MSDPVTFLDRARDDVGTAKVAALAAGCRRLAENRRHAAAEYPPMEAVQERVRGIRLRALRRLDELLGQFSDRVEGLGGHVFFAADGAEAGAYITRVARQQAVASVVKSKSMVTEEIELNAVIEAAGIDVLETDLGEFIVQLAGDKPSHIIAPIMHWTRREVGELFSRRLNVAYTDDPAELNAIARRHLRQRFLRADMGVTGCNVAIAESGSVVVVTNEGNGWLTTTAPRTHVVVMGMERIVGTLAEAASILEVLARSATGQRLSVYTNVVTGPRRPGEPDGPDELHVVILDNGRSEVLGSDLAEVLACIRCGACLNVCPVYREVGGHAYGSTYSGPVGAVLTPALLGLAEWHDLAYASSLCGACREACPVRIDIPRLLLQLRRESSAGGLAPLPRALRMYAAAAVRPRLWRALLKAGGLFGGAFGQSGWIGSLPGTGAGWTDHRDLPRPAARSFRERWSDRET